MDRQKSAVKDSRKHDSIGSQGVKDEESINTSVELDMFENDDEENF